MHDFRQELKNAFTEAKRTLNVIEMEIESETDQVLKEMLSCVLNNEQTEDMPIDEVKTRLNNFRKLYNLIKNDVDKVNHKGIAESISKSFKNEAIKDITKIKKLSALFKNDYTLYEIARVPTFFGSSLTAKGIYGIHIKYKVYFDDEEFNTFKALLSERLSSELLQYFNKDDIELSFFLIDGLAGGVLGKRIMLRIKLLE